MRNVHTSAIALAAAAGFALAAHAQETQGNDPGAPSFCDKQWHMVDGSGDGFVSRGEASSAIDAEFDQIDADDNGEITKTEYVDCKTRTGEQQAATADRNEESFSEADADQNDALTREEFRESARQAFEESQSAAGTGDDAFLVLRRYVWLTPEEGQDAAAVQDMSEEEVAARSVRTFNALDTNDDDIIDTREWAKQSPVSGPSEEQASLDFDKIDADATNSISKEEYQQARQDLLDPTTTASTNESAGTSDGQQASQASEEAGVPVFLYHFSF